MTLEERLDALEKWRDEQGKEPEPKKSDKEPDPDHPAGLKVKNSHPDETPGWAQSLSDRMASLERRIPLPRASSKDDNDDGSEGEDDGDDDILSIEEIEEAIEDIPEKVHGLFRMWGGKGKE